MHLGTTTTNEEVTVAAEETFLYYFNQIPLSPKGDYVEK
jgi:hypothetical protein